MGENNSKWNNWQSINFQNIKTAHTSQYQRNKQPVKKWAKVLNKYFSEEGKQMANKHVKRSLPSLIIRVLAGQSCPTLCKLMDCSLSGSSVHGIFQASILEWVAISFSRGYSWPRDWTRVSCTAGRLFTVWGTREAHYYQSSLSKLQCDIMSHQTEWASPNNPQATSAGEGVEKRKPSYTAGM